MLGTDYEAELANDLTQEARTRCCFKAVQRRNAFACIASPPLCARRMHARMPACECACGCECACPDPAPSVFACSRPRAAARAHVCACIRVRASECALASGSACVYMCGVHVRVCMCASVSQQLSCSPVITVSSGASNPSPASLPVCPCRHSRGCAARMRTSSTRRVALKTRPRPPKTRRNVVTPTPWRHSTPPLRKNQAERR
eukprot:6206668-Pleurochrysis_carterae.AAC.1